MLIRYQNRIGFLNVNQITDLAIKEEKVDRKTIYLIKMYYPFSIENDYSSDCLAIYTTEQKALKVLDMIQEWYQYCSECKYIGAGSKQPEFVFQMPKDDEVEE